MSEGKYEGYRLGTLQGIISNILAADLEVGSIVAVHALDWAVYEQQLPRNSSWKIVEAMIYGEVVAANGEFVAIAHQVFVDGDVRNVLVVPIAAIKSVQLLRGVL